MKVSVSSGRRRMVLATLVLALALVSCSRPHEFNGTVFDNPAPAFPFAGANYTGEPFRLSDQQGKVIVVFFGYTFCPDICPLALADLKQVAAQLGEKAQDLAVVFVTVDPERDTLERLGAYVSAFDPAFYGVRLEGEMYETTKVAYGVYAEKSEVETGDPNSYFVDHTAGVYVIDQAGNLVEAFRYDAGVDALLPDIDYWLEQ
ncbi:MAG: SCO family protein [Caldilineaceae bacterium]